MNKPVVWLDIPQIINQHYTLRQKEYIFLINTNLIASFAYDLSLFDFLSALKKYNLLAFLIF